MRRRITRRVTALSILFVFALSISFQGLTATISNAKMMVHAFQSDMASSPGDPMDCPGHDGVDQATCMAACAGFIGILFEPAALRVVETRGIHAHERIVSLSDRSVPPDPYPPRPSALI